MSILSEELHIPLRKMMLMRVIATSNPLIETSYVFANSDIAPPDGATQRQILQLPHPGQCRVQLSRSKTGPDWQIKMNAVQRLPLSLVNRHGVGWKNRKLSETSDNPGIQARLPGRGNPDGIFVVEPSVPRDHHTRPAQQIDTDVIRFAANNDSEVAIDITTLRFICGQKHEHPPFHS